MQSNNFTYSIHILQRMWPILIKIIKLIITPTLFAKPEATIQQPGPQLNRVKLTWKIYRPSVVSLLLLLHCICMYNHRILYTVYSVEGLCPYFVQGILCRLLAGKFARTPARTIKYSAQNMEEEAVWFWYLSPLPATGLPVNILSRNLCQIKLKTRFNLRFMESRLTKTPVLWI